MRKWFESITLKCQQVKVALGQPGSYKQESHLGLPVHIGAVKETPKERKAQADS